MFDWCRYVVTEGAILILGIGAVQNMSAQEMTLDEAISNARSYSVQALKARQEFISSYWTWRSYKASRLPSLSIYGNLMSFDRSLTLLQSYEDGTFRYASSFNLQNSIGLSVTQNITFTGGRLSVYSDLHSIDQYGAHKNLTWYSQPITVSYNQPLFAYNQFKWDKLIEPKEYEKGRRQYLESMEEVTIMATKAYFDLVAASKNHEASVTNFAHTVKMRSIAGERLKLGTVTRDEYLQLELRSLNDSIAIGENLVKVREAQMALNSILGFDESVEILSVIDDSLPELVMDYDMVLDKALKNSSYTLDNEIQELNAASAVAKGKADRGITMSLNARFGLSQSGRGLPDVYRDLLNQEVVGLTFNVPIFDWGLGKGKVQKAKAAEEVIKAQILQEENDFRRRVFTAVGQFNNQRQQCIASKRAMEIASERYSLMMDKFRNGNATVTDLTNAQKDSDSCLSKYVEDLSNYWNYYYTLRKLTLYDFLNGRDIDIDVTEMIE